MLIPTFVAKNTQTQTVFNANSPRSIFGFQCKGMCHFSISASFSIIVTNFQQIYVVLTAIRRSGGISKISLIKKLKSKVYVSFRIRL